MRSRSAHARNPGQRQRQQQQQRQLTRAFTLVELLVVIGIVVVLIALLFPLLGVARKMSEQVGCAANLRQWAAAVHMFAGANEGDLPRRGQGVNPTIQVTRERDWFNALPTYLASPPYSDLVTQGRIARPGGDNSVWVCRSALPKDGDYYWSYGMNMALSVETGSQNLGRPDKITRLGDTSTMVFMADAPGNYCSVFPSRTPDGYNPVPRHRGYVNIAFLDGHVAAFRGEYIGVGTGLIERPDVRWRPPESTWNSAQ